MFSKREEKVESSLAGALGCAVDQMDGVSRKGVGTSQQRGGNIVYFLIFECYSVYVVYGY